MIRVLFFAKLRETLATPSLELAYAGDVAGLKRALSARGESWQQALTQDNILCAVNQQVATDEQLLKENDEVAFFPPVTGG
ncbi:molybdopterin converting factor subunit 1 [Spongiibacter sp.]|uniref:molybdopterin converting factor subunit 1 n=1 Tax=Spongiibacter sp. TaxID=2024860 RepID=UPI00356A6C7A